MPSKSVKQAGMMAARCRGKARGPGKKVSKKVACEYHRADVKSGMAKKALKEAAKKRRKKSS
ncbi:hypothetical protein AMJ71_06115 [candidate division TA06 bacterium SM1_40]|uniref:Uncharacterized protein n=1 Tax=candidate division TA06 bacterium SM1_40 TaxID=1703773 RepID=A0A0S8JID8_UNCT6|nr:MAG: hypothetical protein AMJ71_06115 [candidate division TA06 bacterium SM1_40]